MDPFFYFDVSLLLEKILRRFIRAFPSSYVKWILIWCIWRSLLTMVYIQLYYQVDKQIPTNCSLFKITFVCTHQRHTFIIAHTQMYIPMYIQSLCSCECKLISLSYVTKCMCFWKWVCIYVCLDVYVGGQYKNIFSLSLYTISNLAISILRYYCFKRCFVLEIMKLSISVSYSNLCLCIPRSIYLSMYINASLYLSFYLPVYISVYQSVCLSCCLCIY